MYLEQGVFVMSDCKALICMKTPCTCNETISTLLKDVSFLNGNIIKFRINSKTLVSFGKNDVELEAGQYEVQLNKELNAQKITRVK